MSVSALPQAGGRGLKVAGATVSVATVVAVAIWALHQEAPRLPTSAAEIGALGGAVALYLLSCAVRGERWMVLLRRNGAEPARADAYGLIAVGYLGNNVLPARAGDALRVLLLTPRASTDARTVVGTLLAERLLDVLVLGGVFAVVAYGALRGIEGPSIGRVALAGGLGALLLGLAAVAAWLAHRRGRLERLLAFIGPMIRVIRRLRGRHGAEVLGLTVLVWTCEAGAWWTVGEAAGLELTVLGAGYLLALASLLAVVPSGPGQAGTLDAAIVFGVRALGRAPAAALSYLLLLRFVIIVPITLVGLAVLVARYGGVQRLRAAA